jgi:uncharacterized protein involved in outer membrane biogenesis
MGKLGKIIGILVAVGIVIVVALAAFVRFYLTDERVRALVIPQAEKALARKVAIGSISIGLLRGITIHDFVVNEADGKAEFIKIKSFVLRYDLLPLLRKKLIISEISIEEPTVRIRRYADGKFNFDTLAVMTQKAGPPEKQEAGPAASVLPIALTVDRIRIKQARFALQDDLGQIPAVEARADLSVAVELGRDISASQYNGVLDFIIDAAYGDMKPHLQGKGVFDQSKLNLAMDFYLAEEKVRLDGTAMNYASAADIVLDVSSKKLNLDHLLAAAASLPSTGAEEKPPTRAAKSAPADSLPSGLAARGKVHVEQALYKGAIVNDFNLNYTLAQGILTIQNLTAKAFGGEATSNVTVDLNNSDISYKGDVALREMQAAELTSVFAKKVRDILSGSLQSSMIFSGTGTEWSMIRNTLSADGKFSIQNGRIQNTPLTKTIAGLINLPELNDLSFKDIAGDVRLVKGGKVELKSQLNSQDITARTAGTVSLDGALDLPLALTLSPGLSKKLGAGTSVAKYLTNEKGEAVLNIKLAGTASDPQPTLDTAGIQKQAAETLKKKTLETIEKSLTGDKTGQGTTGSEATDILKGLLNR